MNHAIHSHEHLSTDGEHTHPAGLGSHDHGAALFGSGDRTAQDPANDPGKTTHGTVGVEMSAEQLEAFQEHIEAMNYAAQRRALAESAPITLYDTLMAWNATLNSGPNPVPDQTLGKALIDKAFMQFWAELKYAYADAMQDAEDDIDRAAVDAEFKRAMQETTAAG